MARWESRSRSRSRLAESEPRDVIGSAEAALALFETGGDRRDLDRGLAGCRAAVAAGPTRKMVDELVDVGRRCLDLAGDRVAECFARERLVLAPLIRYQEFTEAEADLAVSIDHARRAPDSPPEGFRQAAVRLCGILGQALGTRHGRTGSPGPAEPVGAVPAHGP